eukprot:scaffold4361_cov74-Cyclotella_meneghiniana.AAC.12
MQARSKTRTRSTRQQQSSSGCQTSDRGYSQKCKGGVQRDKGLRMAAARRQQKGGSGSTRRWGTPPPAASSNSNSGGNESGLEVETMRLIRRLGLRLPRGGQGKGSYGYGGPRGFQIYKEVGL